MSKVKFVESKHRYCKFTGKKSLLENFPDFLILGPQRTGTTWLAENLRIHPEVFVTDPKEIFFFNSLGNTRHFQHHNQFQPQSNDLSWYLEFFDQPIWVRLRKLFATTKKHGRPYAIKMRGEATASYAAGTDPEVINEILLLNPEIKVVLMVRNPIQRAWSHVKKDLLNESFMNRTERNLHEVNVEEMEEFMASPYQLACGDYRTMITTWGTQVGDGNLHIGFFDDIHNDPESFLLEMFRFLGVRASTKFFSTKLANKIAATDKSDQPRELTKIYQDFLEDLFGDELEWLHRRFGQNFIL